MDIDDDSLLSSLTVKPLGDNPNTVMERVPLLMKSNLAVLRVVHALRKMA